MKAAKKMHRRKPQILDGILYCNHPDYLLCVDDVMPYYPDATASEAERLFANWRAALPKISVRKRRPHS